MLRCPGCDAELTEHEPSAEWKRWFECKECWLAFSLVREGKRKEFSLQQGVGGDGSGGNFEETGVSWRATAFVKPLSVHGDGSKMLAREKLVLFVLADYHNEERNCAWAGLTSIAKAALTSRRHLVTILDDLERKGTLIVQRRTHETNLYWFVGLPSEATSLPREIPAPGGEVRLHQGSEVATAPQPPLNLQKQPTRDLRECEFTSTTPIVKEILRIYEQERGSLPRVREMNAQRLSKCRQRVLNHVADQQKFLADFLAAVRKAGKLKWPEWMPSFDWFVANDTNYQKVLEGNYDRWGQKGGPSAEERKQAIDIARKRHNLGGAGEVTDASRESA